MAGMFACALASSTALAQQAPAQGQAAAGPSDDLTPEQRRAAGAAWDQGMAMRAAGDNASSASFFETADRLAPSPQALFNAIRSHRDAGGPEHFARAATLALRMRVRYPSDTRAVAYADRVVSDLAPQLGRVTVRCTQCELEVDRRLLAGNEFFVVPGAHRLRALWSANRNVSREFNGLAGQTQQLAFDTPPMPPPVAGSGNNADAPRGWGWLPIPVPIVGMVATAGAGAVLAWSGADTLAGVPAYMMNPTAQALADGQGRETRTNALIGVTAGVGAVTVVLIALTRWSNPPRVVVAPGAQSSAQGSVPAVLVGGRF